MFKREKKAMTDSLKSLLYIVLGLILLFVLITVLKNAVNSGFS